VGVEFGRADVVDALGRFAECEHSLLRALGAHEVRGAQFGVAVADALVDGAGDFAAFDVRRGDVLHGADDGSGQCLHPVTVDHHQVGPVLVDKIGEAQDGLGENEILRVAFALVHELEELGTRKALHLQPRFAVAPHHVHAGDEESHRKSGLLRGQREWFELAEIGSRTGDEEQAPAGHHEFA